jgi:adenylate cyclase
MKPSLAFARKHVLPAIVFFGVALPIGQIEWVRRIENLTLDQRTRWRAHFQASADPQVMLLGIDDDSLKIFNRWPWPRNVHAQMLAAVAPAKPSVVAWDVVFSEPGNPEIFDVTLAAGARQLPGRVIFAAYSSNDVPDPPIDWATIVPTLQPIRKIEGDVRTIYSDASALLPIPRLRAAGLTAFVDTPAGFDGVRRIAPMLVRVGDYVYPSLSLHAVLRHFGLTVDDVRVHIGDAIYIEGGRIRRRIPIDETGGYFVNYRHGAQFVDAKTTGGFPLLSYAWVVEHFTEHYLQNKPDVEVPDIAGKIILVGQMSVGLSDNGPTPFSPETPLVLVHANVIENILRNDFVRRISNVSVWIGAVLLGVIGLAWAGEGKGAQRMVFGLGVPVIYVAAATAIWIASSTSLPVVWPLLGFAGLEVFDIVRHLVAEQKAKEQIKGMFGTYLSPALVTRMIDSGEMPRLGGHEDEITAYFSDIQSFSTFSEKLPPERLVELMNEYLTVCTDIVQEEGGTLDKYIGDAVVAMFGAPIALPDHAFRACVASQRVQQKLGELRAKWEGEGDKWPAVVKRMQSRIGLNTGVCTIGNMGSRTRFNYTMMGDNVNLGARMESGAKSWGVYTMCTEATKLACEQHGADRVVFRPLGRIVVKGRSQPVPIFEIVGLKEIVAPAARECIEIFSAGLAKFYTRDWAGARAAFQRSSGLEPNIPGKTPGVVANPSLVYIALTDSYEVEPPPQNWDGVYVMKEK